MITLRKLLKPIRDVQDGLEDRDMPLLLFALGNVNIGAALGLFVHMRGSIFSIGELAALYGVVGLVFTVGAFFGRRGGSR